MIRVLGRDMPAPQASAPVWCPTCGHVVSTCTWLGSRPVRPPAGQPAICGHCMGVSVFLGRGYYMRRATAADLVRLRGDAGTWPVLRAQLVEEIRRRARSFCHDPWLAEKMAWDPSKMVPPWSV